MEEKYWDRTPMTFWMSEDEGVGPPWKSGDIRASMMMDFLEAGMDIEQLMRIRQEVQSYPTDELTSKLTGALVMYRNIQEEIEGETIDFVSKEQHMELLGLEALSFIFLEEFGGRHDRDGVIWNSTKGT